MTTHISIAATHAKLAQEVANSETINHSLMRNVIDHYPLCITCDDRTNCDECDPHPIIRSDDGQQLWGWGGGLGLDPDLEPDHDAEPHDDGGV